MWWQTWWAAQERPARGPLIQHGLANENVRVGQVITVSPRPMCSLISHLDFKVGAYVLLVITYDSNEIHTINMDTTTVWLGYIV